MRKIVHIDMDAFYASIEQRDNKNLKDIPIAVGYSGNRGVVAAASYEARKYGVRSAMPSKTALKKCPHLTFVSARFDVYKSVSQQIMEIFREYTPLVEPLSLDEAFLDVTENLKGLSSATEVARDIKEKIFEKTSLTASAGVSFNKFLAKIASDYKKPNGLFIIKPKDAEKFVEQLPIEQFYGVGKITAQKMHQLGIKNGWDLKQKTEEELVKIFGKAGHAYYKNARAIDERIVEPNRIRKSIGSENTFNYDLGTLEEIYPELENVAKDVFNRIRKNTFRGRTVTLKAKYSNFKIVSRSKTLPFPIQDYETLYNTSIELLKEIQLEDKIRLLGVSLKNNEEPIYTDAIQLTINFDESAF